MFPVLSLSQTPPKHKTTRFQPKQEHFSSLSYPQRDFTELCPYSIRDVVVANPSQSTATTTPFSAQCHLLKDTKSYLDINTHTTCNMEVVVSAHTERTTTSEQSQLGVITSSKRKLITSEIPDPHKQSAFACSTTTVQTCPQPY
jgi:hypothetical protein